MEHGDEGGDPGRAAAGHEPVWAGPGAHWGEPGPAVGAVPDAWGVLHAGRGEWGVRILRRGRGAALLLLRAECMSIYKIIEKNEGIYFMVPWEGSECGESGAFVSEDRVRIAVSAYHNANNDRDKRMKCSIQIPLN